MQSDDSKKSDMNELVSIIVPAYNAETWLEKCIDSILSQSYSNIEIVLIDDGSTDSSSEIAIENLSQCIYN